MLKFQRKLLHIFLKTYLAKLTPCLFEAVYLQSQNFSEK